MKKSKEQRLLNRIKKDYDISDPSGLLYLEVAQNALNDLEEARQVLKTDGITIPDRKGSIKKHPAWSIAKEANMLFLRAIRALNLNPNPEEDK